MCRVQSCRLGLEYAATALLRFVLLMEKNTLLQQFRYITSLASLAYTFTTLHTIQYAMRDPDNDTITQPSLPHDHDLTNPSALSSGAQDTSTTSTSENLEPQAEKTSGRWTEDDINLLLDYVEGNCILTTARGLNLKKSDFNKARAMVKSKDSGQCHYKWGHVRILSFMFIFIAYQPLQLCTIYRAASQWDKKSGAGWHDDYGANARTASEKQVFEEFLKTPEVRRTITLIGLIADK